MGAFSRYAQRVAFCPPVVSCVRPQAGTQVSAHAESRLSLYILWPDATNFEDTIPACILCASVYSASSEFDGAVKALRLSYTTPLLFPPN